MITVEQTNEGDPLVFIVTVTEVSGETIHQVTLSQADYQKLTAGKISATACVRAAFEFLLERESKEAILKRFDITVISQYFSNFEHELPRYLARF